MRNELDVTLVGPDRAAEVVGVIHRAFAARPPLDPPATAGDETVETVAASLERDGGLLATRRGHPMGAILFDRSRPGMLGLKRVSVDPLGRDRGVASVMVGVAEDVAEEQGMDGIWLTVREELPANYRFWNHRLYLPVRQDGPTIEMGKTLWLAREVPDADAMRDLAARVAGLLGAGDLLVLTGGLGAGKTTFTQGLGEALGVRGPVTSPTFVIARTHPSEVGGPPLVHVDAYRLGDAAEIDDIDLDATTDESVTVVEWGEGMAEQLSDSWLSISIETRAASPGDPLGTACGIPSDEMRVVSIRPHGRRWLEVPLRSALLG
ncbi:tRNA (adenosine(37)-N6)-threonylcarbamoyltransferase complex ATPase subunit type 1 TsaE [Aeromicrobium choanae]|uniref:tRNA threonylcarbamoyladenosine biosynthesis protein TsaE n=1 Tax=Aeromicrobium choanae TaxID=1736691 RepID=A0A1T4YVC4_9ACTN|nr:tRNA (adenosine(37)-N6)-threonylcarbamoyltransferase complex ATPase subunit type 1 TsaE [Aeromicrobium choanae]SKB05185.1 tRNA threonylcarbamoyladenosine biosynthesis protein TsaE [Aeromicrobium choanae]